MTVTEKEINARFEKEKKEINDKYDNEMEAAKKQPTKALRETAEKVALRHYNEATTGLGGVIARQMKTLENLNRKK